MPRTNLVNAVDVALAAAVTAPDLEITVDDALPLPAVPFYLVVDPFNDTQGREYMLCTAVAVNVLTVTRSLAGSDSDIHDSGDIVRITVAAQHISDLWTDIEAIPPQTFLHADLSDVASDQHHSRYQDTEAVSAVGPHTPDPTGLYLLLTGGILSGDLSAPNYLFTGGAGAIKDNTGQNRIVVNAGGDMLLVNATGGTRLTLGTEVTLGANLDVASLKLKNLPDTALGDPQDASSKKYVDDQIATVAPVPQTFLHADLTDVGSLPSAHHAKYLDSEAIAAVGPHTPDPTGVYLLLTGGTLTGHTTVNGVPLELVGDSVGLSIYGAPANPLNGFRIFKTGIQLHIYSEDKGGDIALFTDAEGGQMNMYGRMLVVNDALIGSGFMEAFNGAGRHVVRYGAGANSTDGNFWQVIGPQDTSPEQVAFRFSAASGAGQPFVATTDRGPYTDMASAATNPGAGNMSNISFSLSAPVGGISGDVHLVTSS